MRSKICSKDAKSNIAQSSLDAVLSSGRIARYLKYEFRYAIRTLEVAAYKYKRERYHGSCALNRLFLFLMNFLLLNGFFDFALCYRFSIFVADKNPHGDRNRPTGSLSISSRIAIRKRRGFLTVFKTKATLLNSSQRHDIAE